MSPTKRGTHPWHQISLRFCILGAVFRRTPESRKKPACTRGSAKCGRCRHLCVPSGPRIGVRGDGLKASSVVFQITTLLNYAVPQELQPCNSPCIRDDSAQFQGSRYKSLSTSLTRVLTASTDRSKASCSSVFSSNSTTLSTPSDPRMAGTPTNIPFSPNSPSR